MSQWTESGHNPYVVGNPVTGTAFYGREDVFRFVQDTLIASRQNAVVLYGQRRMGKTSILRELPIRLPAGKFHAVYFDLQGWAAKPLAEVLHGLAEIIAQSLGMRLPAMAEFKADRDFFRQNFLPWLWERLSDLDLLILIDEFDVSGDRSGGSEEIAHKELYPYLRKLLDDEKRLAFVFVVGRRLEELPHWILRVFKEAQHKKIGLLRELEARALIVEPARGGLTYDAEAIKAILALTSRHAYFTQLMCYELFNYVRRLRRDEVTPTDVKMVVNSALQTGEPALVWLWEGLTPNGQLLLSAIADVTSGGGVATEAQILADLQKNRLRPPGSEWNKTARILVEWDILEQNGDGGYHFVIELVRRWVLQAHPIAREKARISDLSRQAASLFQAARESYAQGKLDEAVEIYRAALADNPNHLGAWLGLGRALQDGGDLAAAVEALEEAFWLDEAQGRANLVAARLALGEDREHQGQFDEAAVHFRRALVLDPENRRLQERLQFLYDQGVKAMSARRWHQAVVSLERVTDVQSDYRDAAHRLKKARQQARDAPSRLVVAVVSGLLAFTLGVGIGALIPGVPGVLLGRPIPTSTQEVVVSVSDTATSPVKVVGGTVGATPTTEVVVSTEEASPVAGTSPTPTETPRPSATLPPTDMPTPSSTPTPVVVTASSTPTPILPSYPAPQLVEPDDEAIFVGRFSSPILEWSSVGNLGPNDYYIVTLQFQEKGIVVFDRERRKETSWEVDQRLLDRMDASNPEFKWWVVVSHITTDAGGNELGIEVSPVSETRTFIWKE